MDFSLLPLHKHLQYVQACCDMINSEWHRSTTARLHSLQSSCDSLPTALILLHKNSLIGHVKLTSIPTIKNGCFLESVVIKKEERSKGFGKVLMKMTEDYCKEMGLSVIYLSTKGQEGFYEKLGYKVCQPVSIYGQSNLNISKKTIMGDCKAPPAPPLPKINIVPVKTHMKKNILN